MGSDEEILDQVIKKTYDFFESLGAKMNLTEWNIGREYFPEMIDRLVKGNIGEVTLTRKQITEILNKCLI